MPEHFYFCVWIEIILSARYLALSSFNTLCLTREQNHPRKFTLILVGVPSVRQMEALHYVLGEQVGGAAGMKNEQPNKSKIEKSVSERCVYVCVKREQVPQRENLPQKS